MKLVNIGFGSMLNVERITAIVNPDSAPIKRLIQDFRDKGKLIDATHGRKTRAVIITDSDQVILSYLQTETLSGRLEETDREDVQWPKADLSFFQVLPAQARIPCLRNILKPSIRVCGSQFHTLPDLQGKTSVTE